MGWSINLYRGKVLDAHDSNLSAIACLMEELWADFNRPHDKDAIQTIDALIELWHHERKYQWCPGCVDLHLDEHLTSPASVGIFVELLEGCRKWMLNHGDAVPPDVMNRLCQLETSYWEFYDRPQPTEPILRLIDELTDLVRPDNLPSD